MVAECSLDLDAKESLDEQKKDVEDKRDDGYDRDPPAPIIKEITDPIRILYAKIANDKDGGVEFQFHPAFEIF